VALSPLVGNFPNGLKFLRVIYEKTFYGRNKSFDIFSQFLVVFLRTGFLITCWFSAIFNGFNWEQI